MASADTRSAEQDHFDLLPFIAIMMCLLGTLLLVTMSMAAINVGAGAGEGWVPAQDAGAKTPVLIEWDGRYALWHSDRGTQSIEEDFTQYVNTASGWIRILPIGTAMKVSGPRPSPFDPLIDYLDAHRKTHYALIAVRPSGFHNFRRFASRFENRQIDLGSEPVDQGKPVHLMLPPGTPQ